MYSIYINTAVSFKSKITNIYYRWAPILDPKIFEKNICIRISSQYSCVTSVTMPGKFIILPVRDNLSSQGISI